MKSSRRRSAGVRAPRVGEKRLKAQRKRFWARIHKELQSMRRPRRAS